MNHFSMKLFDKYLKKKSNILDYFSELVYKDLHFEIYHIPSGTDSDEILIG